jgi:hypothetical protein
MPGNASNAVQMITSGVTSARPARSTAELRLILSFLVRAYAELGRRDDARLRRRRTRQQRANQTAHLPSVCQYLARYDKRPRVKAYSGPPCPSVASSPPVDPVRRVHRVFSATSPRRGQQRHSRRRPQSYFCPVPTQKPINAVNIADFRQCRRSTSADDHLSFRHRLFPLVSHS